MADRYLLESGSPDGYLLEDGSGVLLLDAVTPLSLTDNFDGNSIDGAKWTTGNLADPSATTTGVTVADTSQQLQITGPASTAAVRYSGLVSVSTYDFTDHAIFVKIANAASIGSFQLAFLIAGVDVNNKYSVQISGGTFVQLLEIVAGGQTAASAQISVGSDVWFRLRHTSTGDQIIVDTAPSTASDPPVESDWTQRIALARNPSVGAITAWKAALNGGLFNSNATPTTIQFDGFNTATVGTVTHATTGALTGPGSTIAGTAAHIAVHGATGALTGPGSTIAGTAAHIAIHGTSGALIGAGSTIVGSAARTTIHATSGVLTGPGSTVAGVAVYNAKHATSGALTGQGSTIIGSATRFRAHATTGALTGPGSVIVGVAVYNAKHSTTGALTGPGSALAGSAARFRAFATSGVLVGPGSTIAGAADHASRLSTHATSGALVGQPSIITGTAARTRVHTTSGILIGPPAFIFGYATRWRDHGSSGILLGVASVVFGRVFNGTPELQDIPVDSDNLVNETSPPSEDLGPITKPSGQIVNHPPYPAA